MSLMERLERLNLVDGQLRGLSVRVEKATSFHRAQTKQLDLEKKRAEEAKANLLQVKAAYGVVETEAKALDEQIETARERMDTSATAKEYNALLVELNTVKNRAIQTGRDDGPATQRSRATGSPFDRVRSVC